MADELRIQRTSVRGPFGALTTGDASECVTHFPQFGQLSPEDQATLNRVWSGREEDCHVYATVDQELLYVRYAPSGRARADTLYGYTVRTAAVVCKRSPEPPVKSGTCRGWVLLLVAGAAVGTGVFAGIETNREPPKPSIHSAAVSVPALNCDARKAVCQKGKGPDNAVICDPSTAGSEVYTAGPKTRNWLLNQNE